ncbi:toxin co-regulated pilus biosynthesis Q family protein [Pseudoduganella violaceinigra]|uniref:toxin co-regulated pilus biosynthesis Q family protein n=1 Tax=Pseudoduganella violaceinigra TaxID=246602 RepID=UPI000428B5EC|nr:toxin co-regulated pilus biosynthesis Q family protein [Pseudoduganella violaceinigra]
MNLNITLDGAARKTLAALGLTLCCGVAAAAPAAAPAVPEAAPAAAERSKPVKPATRLAAAGKGRATVNTAAAPAAEPAERAAPDAWDIVPSDKTLNGALARWAGSAGWQLLWELPVDYAVQVRTTVPGTFEEAVATVVTSMDSAEMPMKAVFYKGNKVLRIMGRGAQ